MKKKAVLVLLVLVAVLLTLVVVRGQTYIVCVDPLVVRPTNDHYPRLVELPKVIVDFGLEGAFCRLQNWRNK